MFEIPYVAGDLTAHSPSRHKVARSQTDRALQEMSPLGATWRALCSIPGGLREARGLGALDLDGWV